MADEEKIDSYVDRPAIADDTKFLTDQFKVVLDLFEKVKGTMSSLGGATTLKGTTDAAKEVQKAMDNLKVGKEKLINVDIEAIRTIKEQVKSMKDLSAGHQELVTQSVKNEIAGKALRDARAHLNAAYKEERITLEQLQEGLEEIKVAEVELKLSNEQLSRALKNLEKDSQGAEGSLDKLRAQLNLSLQAFDALSAEEKKSATGTELTTKIQDLTKAISEEEQATGRFQRNVGNYPGAAKIIVDALSGVEKKISDLQVKQQGLTDFSKRNPIGFRTSGGQNDLDQTNAQLKTLTTQAQSLGAITSNPQFLNVAGKVGDTNAELKFFTKQLNQLEDAGLKNEKVYKDVQKRLAELTDQLGDTRSEIKAMASDTRSFDLFAGAVNFAADTFQTFAGVLALGTNNEKEAQEALKTLVAIQTISNGVKGIANELTTKGTAANKLFAFSQKQIAVAMDTTATSTARLKAALISIGIVALIAGIGLLIANFDTLKRVLSGMSKQQQLLNDVSKKSVETYVQEKVAVEQLVAEGLKEETSKRRKLEIIKELNEKSPVYFGHIRTEKDLQNEATEAVKKYVLAITLKAKAQAAVELLAEKEKAIVLRQVELERQLEAAKTQTFDTEERKQKLLIGLRKRITEGTDETIQALEKDAAPIRKVIESIKQELDNLGGDPNRPIEIPFAATNKVRSGEKEATAAALEQLAAIEDAHLITRINAREKAFQIRKSISDKERDVALENLNAQIKAEDAKGPIDINKQKEFEQSRHDIIADAAEKEKELARARDKDLINIRQTFIAKQRELEEKDNAEFLKDQEDALNKQIDNLQIIQEKRQLARVEGQEVEIKALNKHYEKQIAATKEGSREREKVEREYAERRADIEYSYALAELKTQIEFAEKLIAVRKAAGLDVTSEEQRLHELRLKLSDIETQHVIENNKRSTKDQLEKFDKIKRGIDTIRNVYNETTAFIDGLLSASIDKQKNKIAEQIDEIEKQKEIEIGAINATSQSQQDKAAAIALIEAKAAAQKEALERKQRQLDQQKAKFEKAITIGRIIGDTAAAVVAALGAKPWTPANIAMAIAVGAIGAAQLAVAAATPIPKFKHGRQSGPATWAITGDGGKSEVVTSPDLSQSFVTPSTDTLTYLPKNWKVFPDIDAFQNAAMNMVHKPLPAMPVVGQGNNNSNAGVITEIRELKQVIKNKPVAHITGNHAGVMGVLQYGSTWIEYVDKNVNF